MWRSRLIIALVGVLLLARTAQAITHVTHATPVNGSDESGTAVANVKTAAATFTAGNILFVPWAYYRNGLAAVTVTADDGPTTGAGNGNTWDCTTIGQISTTGDAFGTQGGACFAYNIGGTLTSDIVTIKFSSNSNYVSVQVIELHPTNTTNPYDTSIATNNTGVVSSITSGTFSTAHANEIVACGMTASNVQTWSAGTIAGTSATLEQTVASAQVGSQWASFSSTFTNQTASASISGSTSLEIVCATFWDGSSGGGGGASCKGNLTLLGAGCDDQYPIEDRRH